MNSSTIYQCLLFFVIKYMVASKNSLYNIQVTNTLRSYFPTCELGLLEQISTDFIGVFPDEKSEF